MRKVFLTVSVAAILVLGLSACSSATTSQKTPKTTPPSTNTAPTQQVFTAVIAPLNNSGVNGEATVTVDGTSLQVEISAAGMVPGKPHAQHIHGLSGKASTSPPTDSTTLIPEAKAESYYGQVLVPLLPFPMASATGATTYSASVEASSAVPGTPVLPLAGRGIVLHGLIVNGTYDPSMPVGFGVLTLKP